MPKLPGYLNVFLNLKNSVQNYPKGMDDGHLPVWEICHYTFGNKKLSVGTSCSVCGIKAPTCSCFLSLAYFCLVNKSS